MKTIIACIAIVLVTICQAAEPKPVPEKASLYTAHEWQVDVFGSQTFPNTGAHWLSDSVGGMGVGGNYYLNRYLGFGASAESKDVHRTFVDQAQLNLYGRLPFGTSPLAGYVKTGFGRNFDTDEWFVHQGAGLEYRFTKLIGAFTEAEWVSPTSNSHDYVVGRIGLRLNFR